MADDEEVYSAHGAGKWDINTNRYVPIGGGSRSRLAMGTKGIRPYGGFSGIDEKDANKPESMGGLYARLQGGSRISAQDSAFISARNQVEKDASEPPLETSEAEAPAVEPPMEAAPEEVDPENLLTSEHSVSEQPAEEVNPGLEMAPGQPAVKDQRPREIPESAITSEHSVSAQPAEEVNPEPKTATGRLAVKARPPREVPEEIPDQEFMARYEL